MVNVNYVESNYSDSIKMYRIELDQIPQEEKIGFKVCRNTGHTLTKIGKYRDAIHSY